MSDIPVFKFAVGTDMFRGMGSTLTPKDFLPRKGSERATGWDVRAAVPVRLRAGQYAKIPLGFRIFTPEGWWMELRPRSSTFGKKQLHSLYGVIDEDYEGQCIFACQYIPDINALGNDLRIEFGEAIGQIVPVRRQEMIVEGITEDEYHQLVTQRNLSRGEGGFGSTDKK